MLDADLARLYEVPTKRLNEAVQRNRARFPDDFMFELTVEETAGLRSQFATSKGRGGRRYAPWAFTQEGVAMLSGVLNSPRAIAVNIEIMRAFVHLRRAVAVDAEVARRLAKVEEGLAAHDHSIRLVFETIRKLMTEVDDPPPVRVGFEL